MKRATRIVDSASNKNLAVMFTCFSYRSIYKIMLVSPDGQILSQVNDMEAKILHWIPDSDNFPLQDKYHCRIAKNSYTWYSKSLALRWLCTGDRYVVQLTSLNTSVIPFKVVSAVNFSLMKTRAKQFQNNPNRLKLTYRIMQNKKRWSHMGWSQGAPNGA